MAMSPGSGRVRNALHNEVVADDSNWFVQVLVGYVLDHVLGLCITMGALYCTSHNIPRWNKVAWSCVNAFSDCAIIFALAIQVAASLFLAREDFGKETSGMGDDTVRITQAVSMVVLLALSYPILAFAMRSKSKDHLDTRDECLESSIRFGQFVLVWLLAFYPFYSKMNAAFGPSRIGNTHGTNTHAVLSSAQFEVIQQICFGKIVPITTLENNAMTAFVILTYIPVSLFVLGRILWLGVREKHPDSRLNALLDSCCRNTPKQLVRSLLWTTYIATPFLACGLLWSIIQTRKSQQSLAASFGGTDGDSEWTFGQVVALTVFAPVVVEGYRTWRIDEDHEEKG